MDDNISQRIDANTSAFRPLLAKSHGRNLAVHRSPRRSASLAHDRQQRLLMFPSYLEHSVDTNMSAEERISISFNIMFSSFAEKLSKPLW